MIASTLPESRVLYFLYSNGCDHCHEAMPHIAAYQRENGYRMPILRLNLDFHEWLIGGWSPRGTPAYALMVDGKLVKKHEGILTAVDLKAWLAPAVHLETPP